VYRFFEDRLGLAGADGDNAAGARVLDESHVTIEDPAKMRVFGESVALPENACRTVGAAMASLSALQSGG
jgi:hypothetical protein